MKTCPGDLRGFSGRGGVGRPQRHMSCCQFAEALSSLTWGTEDAAAHKHVNKQKSCRELLALGSDDLWRQARFRPKTCHSFTSVGGCDDRWFPSQKMRTQRGPTLPSGAVTYFSYVSVAPSL